MNAKYHYYLHKQAFPEVPKGCWMLNPHTRLTHIPKLSTKIREALETAGIYRIVDVWDFSDVEIAKNPDVGSWGLSRIRKAIRNEIEKATVLTKIIEKNGLFTPKSVIDLSTTDVMELSGLSTEQIGRVFQYQRDLGSRHKNYNRTVHTAANGRMYECDFCKYRLCGANFCGICYQEIKEKN